MGEILKNKKTGQTYETHPYKCRVCGMGEIKHDYDICSYCGWEDDDIQNDDPNYMGGANQMSLNQYKRFWELNKEDILINKEKNRFYAMDKSYEYFLKHHQKDLEEFLKNE